MRTIVAAATVAVLAQGCAYKASEYADGEGSAVCITTERLSNRIQGSWTGEVERVEEAFVPEEKVWVNVIFHHAVGEDCDRISFAECELGFDGNEVKISATAQWEYAKNRENCDGPIEPLVASCQTVGLDEDTWTFTYSDMDLVIDVPSSVETPCLDLDPQSGCSTAPGAPLAWLVMLPVLALVRRR